MSRKTTINVPDELYEKALAISKYYDKPISNVMNIALELLFANLPKVNYREFSIYLSDNKKHDDYPL
jgi:hypothetical protein